MNLPNQLTVGRLALTLLFLGALFARFPLHETVALVLFIGASLTDYFDGSIARGRGLITNFGVLMDPLADKILVCSAFIAFVGLDLIPAWMVVIVVVRELAITGLRLLAASKHVVLAAEGYGKHKTISQVTAIIAIIVAHAHAQWGGFGHAVFGLRIWGQPWVVWVAEVSKWAAVVLTLTSGALYMWRNRGLYLEEL